MTEIPIVVSTNEITVGGVVDQIELQLGLGEKGDRGSRIFSGDVSPLTLPANSPFFSGYTEFKPGDVYVERSATNIAMWEWKSQPGGYTWVKTADIAVSGGGGMTSLDPDLTAIADLTGTSGLLRKSGVNTWLLDTNSYLALSGGTLTGKVNTVASAAGGAGFNLPHGSAPTSPTNGDVWTTTAGMYVRVNGTTVGPFGTGAVWGSITGTLSSQTDLNTALGAKLDTAGGTLSGNLTVNAIIYGNNPGSTFQSTTGSEIALQLYESTGSSTMLYSTGDGYLGWVGRRKTGWTRRYSFESNPSPSSGANFGLWLYDSAGANSKGVWYATYNTSLLPANLTFDSSTTFNNPINANSIVPISGTLSLNYGSSAFDAVRSGQLQVVREGVGANNTLFATYPTNAALVADTPNFIVFGSGAFSGTGTGTVLSTTNSYLKIDGGAGYERQMQFLSGGSLRWTFGATSTAESGSNAGSDLWLTRYDDNGSSLGEVFGVYRATGKITFRAVDSSAGLELGSNGPRIMVGTGTPEGSVTAPVGSEWTDTNTGIKYAKMAGTGTTGWSPQTPISQQGYVEETQVMMMMGVL